MERIKVLKLNQSYYLRIPNEYVKIGNVDNRSVFGFRCSMPIKGIEFRYKRGL